MIYTHGELKNKGLTDYIPTKYNLATKRNAKKMY